MQSPQLQILSLPKIVDLNSYLPTRYPLYYKVGVNPQAIRVPVGSLKCTSSCYTDISDNNAVQNNICQRCERVVMPHDRFIDVGLMNLMVRYYKEIDLEKPYYLEYDSDTSNVHFTKKEETLQTKLAEMATTDTMAVFKRKFDEIKKNGNEVLLNYPSIKNLFTREMEGKIGAEKPDLLTWCRGRLYLDQSFGALNLNFKSSPNKVVCFQLTDESGKLISIDYKNTHIHYLPEWRIFVLLVSEGQTPNRKLGIRVIDINTLSLGSQTVTVLPIKEEGRPIPGRIWYSTCVDYKTTTLYVVGGLGNEGFTADTIISIKLVRWLPDIRRLEFELKTDIKYEALQVASVVPAFFEKGDDKTNLVVIGGVAASVALRFETFKYEPRASIYFISEMQRMPILADNSKKFGAYTHVIEIPTTKIKDRVYRIRKGPKVIETGPMLLVFGGTDDYIVDSVGKREEFSQPFIYCPSVDARADLERIEIYANGSMKKAKLSNKQYPYLNDNSSIFIVSAFEDGDQKLTMRMLIPKRNTITQKDSESAFLLEVILESEVNLSVVREYEVQCKMAI